MNQAVLEEPVVQRMNQSSLLLIRRALISVSDKREVVELARALKMFGVEIISTGGTAAALREQGIEVTSVSEVTGFPEILDGRVKTLHPGIHAGLLAASDNPDHVAQLDEHGIKPIDLLVVNLYPFEQTVSREPVSLQEAIEQIDIGGPAMVRAAAKNYRHTAVVVNPRRYDSLIQELKEHEGAITEATRSNLARDAFRHTAQYDAAIATYLDGVHSTEKMPDFLSLTMRKGLDLRYGENPHQPAAFYGEFSKSFEKLHGKDLSYNNLLDMNAAIALCEEFSEPTVVIIKHNNPCGVGSGANLVEAYRKALATDAKSAFGGIIAVNRSLDENAARALHDLFTEIIIAPEFSKNSLALLTKKKDRRLVAQKERVRSVRDVRSALGGWLVQESDNRVLEKNDLKVVTKRSPTEQEIKAMLFAWSVAKHVKSNAIIYAREDRTLGIGAGQMSRVDSSKIAALKALEAGLELKGCAVASDAFFPFADGLLEAVKVGATAVIQPGGSVRDAEVIAAADENNIAMVFTGVRHFRH